VVHPLDPEVVGLHRVAVGIDHELGGHGFSDQVPASAATTGANASNVSSPSTT
jgi:hypothetical protein